MRARPELVFCRYMQSMVNFKVPIRPSKFCIHSAEDTNKPGTQWSVVVVISASSTVATRAQLLGISFRMYFVFKPSGVCH